MTDVNIAVLKVKTMNIQEEVDAHITEKDHVTKEKTHNQAMIVSGSHLTLNLNVHLEKTHLKANLMAVDMKDPNVLKNGHQEDTNGHQGETQTKKGKTSILPEEVFMAEEALMKVFARLEIFADILIRIPMILQRKVQQVRTCAIQVEEVADITKENHTHSKEKGQMKNFMVHLGETSHQPKTLTVQLKNYRKMNSTHFLRQVSVFLQGRTQTLLQGCK